MPQPEIQLLISPSDSSNQSTSLEFTPTSPPDLAISVSKECVSAKRPSFRAATQGSRNCPETNGPKISLDNQTGSGRSNIVPTLAPTRPGALTESSRESPFSDRRLPLPPPFPSNPSEGAPTVYRGLPFQLQQSEPPRPLPPISCLPSLADFGIKPLEGIQGGPRSYAPTSGQREDFFNQDWWNRGRGSAHSYRDGPLDHPSRERQTRLAWNEVSNPDVSRSLQSDDQLVDVLGYKFGDRNQPTAYEREDAYTVQQGGAPVRQSSRPFEGEARLSASSERFSPYNSASARHPLAVPSPYSRTDGEQLSREFTPRDQSNVTSSTSGSRIRAYPPSSDLLPSTLPLKRQRIDSLGRRAWTDEEDRLLKTAIMREGFGRWTEIAKSVPERTPDACRKRWEKVLDPSIRKGPWTSEEDELLTGLVERFGKRKWTQIASQIPGRTDKQCRQRWFDHLVAPMVRRSAVQLAAAAASAAGGNLQHGSPGEYGAQHREFGEEDRRVEMPPRSYKDTYPTTRQGPPQAHPHTARPAYYLPPPNARQNARSSAYSPYSDRPPPPTPSMHSYRHEG
ncbi:hypothetical protein BJ742DRAFT_840032 [Cladochytrium replicatum]|nr:hypothetical protein BJ742DRAFT_840032 [Cladochytrium replicatum]